MEALAIWSGWLAATAVALAALVPLVARLRAGRRAAPTSPTIRSHVALGVATAALAFGHTMVVLPALGSPAATGGGMAALLPGVAAFFVLLAHVGVGLQLRDPKLRDRPKKRRVHAATATTIALAVALHAILLERAGR